MKRNVVAIAGLETIKDSEHKVKYFAATFLNNLLTWKKDHPNDDVKILDARDYRDRPNPMGDIWLDAKAAFIGIDVMLLSTHSDWEGLYVISKYRKGEIDDSLRYIDCNTSWEGFTWNPNACIRIMGCQAGGRFGKKWNTSIAQILANKSGVLVYAFCDKSSQRRRKDGGYVMVPDTGGYVRFYPKKIIPPTLLENFVCKWGDFSS